jgi:septum formation protein
MARSPDQPGELVLASASPRRRDILGQMNLRFRVIESGVEEGQAGSATPEAYARATAERKAQAVAARMAAQGGRCFVLGADTIVVIDRQVLGKPVGEGDAARMMRLLRGRDHEVITAVRLQDTHGAFARTIAVSSRVTFRALDEATVARYAASGEGRDKAGAYAVQGLGAGLVRAIDGSYTNVVGLPACETLELLIEAGVVGSWP